MKRRASIPMHFYNADKFFLSFDFLRNLWGMSQKKHHKTSAKKGKNKRQIDVPKKVIKREVKEVWPTFSDEKDKLYKKIFLGISVSA